MKILTESNIKITNVQTISGARTDFYISGINNHVPMVSNDSHIYMNAPRIIDGSKLLALPGLIDPHVHFRVPGMEHKEDWITGAMAAFHGGYTTVFDMPNTKPATVTYERLQDKIALIDSQIKASKCNLKYRLFFGADKNNFQEISKVHDQVVGIKVFMGASTGDLLMDDESSLHAIYALAKHFNLPIALHAEDEAIIRQNMQLLDSRLDSKINANNPASNLANDSDVDFKYHSIIRSVDAAVKAVTLVIELSRLYQVRSYILHVSTKQELDLIAKAKAEGILVFAETCPHYLFLDDTAYATLHGLVKMNPPLRAPHDREYLWSALNSGLIDTIASDHAPHTLEEKEQPLCRCPSGIPGIETALPLLLTAYKAGKISLERIIQLTHDMPKRIFNLPDSDDIVFVNIEDYKVLDNADLYTKVKWSPYSGMRLTGFPELIKSNNTLYILSTVIN
jgi:dihydroorotase